MTIEGKSVYSGVAIGRLAIYHKADNQVKREKSVMLKQNLPALKRQEILQKNSSPVYMRKL